MFTKVKRITKEIYNDIFHPILGVVYMFHRVIPKEHDRLTHFDNLSVTPEYFREFILSKQNKQGFISLNDLPGRLGRRIKRSEKPFALITFDDGYRDNYDYAFPILQQTNTPFTIFLTCNFIDNKRPFNYPFILERIIYNNSQLFLDGKCYRCVDMEQKNEVYKLLEKEVLTWKYEGFEDKFKTYFANYINDDVYEDNMLTWEQVKEMQDCGLCDIGAHTMSHCRLSNLSIKELEYELGESKKIISQKIGKDIKCMSYPYGLSNDTNGNVFKVTKETGYDYSFLSYGGVIRKTQMDYFQIKRLYVFDGYRKFFNDLY